MSPQQIAFWELRPRRGDRGLEAFIDANQGKPNTWNSAD